MKRELERLLVVELCAVCREAERSLDAALKRPWEELLGYFHTSRVRRLESLIERLHELEPDVRLGRAEMERLAGPDGLHFLLLRAWNRWKPRWRFTSAEIGYFAATLETVRGLLARSRRPDDQCLIDARRACYFAQWLIKRRVGRSSEIRRADRIEHFCGPPCADLSMTQLLGPQAADDADPASRKGSAA